MNVSQAASIAVFVAALSLPIASANAAGRPRRFALVVSQNEGDVQDVRLKYANEDASRIADVLKSVGGVASEDLQLIHNVTAAGLVSALDELHGRLARKGNDEWDQLFIYVSSHASDGTLHLAGQRFPMAQLREFLDRAPVAVGILILDACQSGALLRRKGIPEDIGPTPEVNIETPPVRGRVIIASSAREEYSAEYDDLGGSLFTHHFVTGLRGPADSTGDGEVTLGEAFEYSYVNTVWHGEQRQHPKFAIDLEGDRDPVLTRPSAARGRLEILVHAPSSWVVRSADDRNFLATFDKPKGPGRIALAPGRYLVRTSGAEIGGLEGNIVVDSERTTTVTLDDLAQWSPATTRAVKGPVDPAPASGRPFGVALLGLARPGLQTPIGWLYGGRAIATLHFGSGLVRPAAEVLIEYSRGDGPEYDHQQIDVGGGTGLELGTGRIRARATLDLVVIGAYQRHTDTDLRSGVGLRGGLTLAAEADLVSVFFVTLSAHAGLAIFETPDGRRTFAHFPLAFGIGVRP